MNYMQIIMTVVKVLFNILKLKFQKYIFQLFFGFIIKIILYNIFTNIIFTSQGTFKFSIKHLFYLKETLG